MNDTEKFTIAHQFADMLQAIKIDTTPDNCFKLLLLNDTILNIREAVWSLTDCNKTDELKSINTYLDAFDSAITEALPFIHTETTEDNLRDANEKRLQGIAMIINGLKLLVESAK